MTRPHGSPHAQAYSMRKLKAEVRWMRIRERGKERYGDRAKERSE